MIKDEDAKMKKTRLVDQKMIFFFYYFLLLLISSKIT